VFIVTGASSGIGAEIARQLANLGASLVLADIDESGLSEVTTQITQSGGVEPLVVAGDQSDPMRVQETVNTCVDRFGGLDGIVANAGVGVTGFLKDLSLTDWQKAIQINLTSAFLLTKAAMPILIEQGLGGSLVYVASKNAFGPGAGFGAYSVSKAGMVQLAKIAALEGGKYGIRSNAINPDAVFDNSKLWGSGLREERAAAHGIKPEELEDFYASRNLLNRHVTTIDVAHAAVFLLSDASSRTTGAVLPVDGGVAGAFPR
jgi:NAD(P)-dependent dehydrogenase (short-subunit alcohol dehydrogenase family)